MQLTKKHKIHTHKHVWIYTQRNGPNETKPNPENCKNCSSKRAYDCAQLQYTIQHRTVLISPFLYKQPSQLRFGLLEEKGPPLNKNSTNVFKTNQTLELKKIVTGWYEQHYGKTKDSLTPHLRLQMSESGYFSAKNVTSMLTIKRWKLQYATGWADGWIEWQTFYY